MRWGLGVKCLVCTTICNKRQKRARYSHSNDPKVLFKEYQVTKTRMACFHFELTTHQEIFFLTSHNQLQYKNTHLLNYEKLIKTHLTQQSTCMYILDPLNIGHIAKSCMLIHTAFQSHECTFSLNLVPLSVSFVFSTAFLFFSLTQSSHLTFSTVFPFFSLKQSSHRTHFCPQMIMSSLRCSLVACLHTKFDCLRSHFFFLSK